MGNWGWDIENERRVAVTTGSPHWLGDGTEMVRRSEGSWLQRTESSVAAHNAARESWSAGNKTEQAQEEGDTPNREQQRDSCPSRATSVGFGPGVGHLPVSVTWVGPCRRWEDVDGALRLCLMRRVRGGWVGGKSETGHGWGQTITRSIEGDIQTEEYRRYRDYLY